MTAWKSHRPDGIPHPFALWLANDETIFVSGLGGHRPDGSISDNVSEQAEQAVATLTAHLEKAGFTLDEVVWFHPYVTDFEYAPVADVAWTNAFGDAPPAAGALLAGVTFADPRMKLEIEAFAIKGARRERVK